MNLKETILANIKECEKIYKFAKENNYLNSQEILDWQDKLNEISVRYDYIQ